MAKTRTQLLANIRFKLDTKTAGGLWGDSLDTYIWDAMTTTWPLLPNSCFTSDIRGATDFTISSPVADSKIQYCVRGVTDMRVLSLMHTCVSPAVSKRVVVLPDLGALYSNMEISNNWTAGISTTYGVVENDQIWVGPVSASDIVTEHFIAKPVEMTADTDTLKLADDYAHVIEDYAVYLALRQVGSPRADTVLRDWKANMASIWQTFSNAPLPAYLAVPRQK